MVSLVRQFTGGLPRPVCAGEAVCVRGVACSATIVPVASAQDPSRLIQAGSTAHSSMTRLALAALLGTALAEPNTCHPAPSQYPIFHLNISS